MSAAVAYAGLIGKYVRMEREPDEVEYLEAKATNGGEIPEGYKVGAEGVVVAVWDSNYRVGGPAVEVMMDYGMGYAVFSKDQWSFVIADTQKTLHGIWELDGRGSRS
jgi:hypothetical protein